MTKEHLDSIVEAAKNETRDALQTVVDELNQGQRKKLVKDATVKELLDRYGVIYE